MTWANQCRSRSANKNNLIPNIFLLQQHANDYGQDDQDEPQVPPVPQIQVPPVTQVEKKKYMFLYYCFTPVYLHFNSIL
jgi:hypothetical protein